MPIFIADGGMSSDELDHAGSVFWLLLNWLVLAQPRQSSNNLSVLQYSYLVDVNGTISPFPSCSFMPPPIQTPLLVPCLRSFRTPSTFLVYANFPLLLPRLRLHLSI